MGQERLQAGRKRIEEEVRNLILVCMGTLGMAFAYALFFTPCNMVPGGFTGLAMVMRRLTSDMMPGGIPLWAGNLILNLPLLVIAGFSRGWRFIGRTMLASGMFSVWLAVIPEHILVPDDLLLTAVFGGILMGFGLGATFLGKATTGGTDTLASLIQKAFPYMSTAGITPVMDAIVIIISAGLFGIRVSMYAVLSIIISGQISEKIVSGFKNAYTAYIISDRHAEIAQVILSELRRGCTSLSGQGMYTEEKKRVLMCAVSRKQVALLKDTVYKIDPNAFMILTDSHEIRGEGFLRYSKDEL